jgi:hypothetical protein
MCNLPSYRASHSSTPPPNPPQSASTDIIWILRPHGASADFHDNEGGTQLMLVPQKRLDIVHLLL